jgi:hypothetical protein
LPAVADRWGAMRGVTGGEVVPPSPPPEQAASVSAERAVWTSVGQHSSMVADSRSRSLDLPYYSHASPAERLLKWRLIS